MFTYSIINKDLHTVLLINFIVLYCIIFPNTCFDRIFYKKNSPKWEQKDQKFCYVLVKHSFI